MRSNGGLIGAKKTVSPTSASGIWAIRDAQRERGALNWTGFYTTRGLVLDLNAGNTSSYSGTGGTWYDLSGNGLNATFTNGTPTFSSSNGGRLEFGANTQYAQVATSALFAVGTGDFTIDMFVQIPNTNSLYNHYFGLPDQNTSVLKSDDSTNNTIYFYDGANSVLFGTTGFNVPPAAWRHLVISRISGTMYGYTDGVLRGSQANSKNLTSQSVRVRPFISAEYTETYITSCRFYNVGLTGTEVLTNFSYFRGVHGL